MRQRFDCLANILQNDQGGSRSRDWGTYGELGARNYKGDLGAVPLVGGQGANPPKLNAFLSCHMPKMALSCYVYEMFHGH